MKCRPSSAPECRLSELADAPGRCSPTVKCAGNRGLSQFQSYHAQSICEGKDKQSRVFKYGSVTSHTITGLQPGVEYKAQVIVNMTVGGAPRSAKSVPLVFTLTGSGGRRATWPR